MTFPQRSIGTGERLLVITPHPDDETLSAAA
jgi:LmbE family N-acetylglucosaminyl deacetylase